MCEQSRGLALSLCLACGEGSMTLQLMVTCVPLAAEGNTLLGWPVAPLSCGLALWLPFTRTVVGEGGAQMTVMTFCKVLWN